MQIQSVERPTAPAPVNGRGVGRGGSRGGGSTGVAPIDGAHEDGGMKRSDYTSHTCESTGHRYSVNNHTGISTWEVAHDEHTVATIDDVNAGDGAAGDEFSSHTSESIENRRRTLSVTNRDLSGARTKLKPTGEATWEVHDEHTAVGDSTAVTTRSTHAVAHAGGRAEVAEASMYEVHWPSDSSEEDCIGAAGSSGGAGEEFVSHTSHICEATGYQYTVNNHTGETKWDTVETPQAAQATTGDAQSVETPARSRMAPRTSSLVI